MDSPPSRPRVLLIYDWFEPAVQAGGPITSCANLVRFLGGRMDFFVLTRNREMDGTRLERPADRWLSWEAGARVCYAERRWGSRGVWRVLREVRPRVIYLNGIYSPVGVLLPLLLCGMAAPAARLVLAPRGMLQAGSLSVKAFKKRLFLPLLCWLLAWRRVTLQVTGAEEEADLYRVFPRPHRVVRLGNVPRTTIERRANPLPHHPPRLVTVALISPMKNILECLQALARLGEPVEYHLFGPVKDPGYWADCQRVVAALPAAVGFVYHGPLDREAVPGVLAEHDIYLQPSRSENFGHALFEALLAGLPLITSSNTPWQDLAVRQAGWNVAGEDPAALAAVLRQALDLARDPIRYQTWSAAARTVAEEYLAGAGLAEGYGALLGVG
ncbi:MAG: glycosyltransferase family 4 protein [Magnetococcales bacterium]|nr:glycosyltransferase family 4 protein [Magnetococcales bacterium]